MSGVWSTGYQRVSLSIVYGTIGVKQPQLSGIAVLLKEGLAWANLQKVVMELVEAGCVAAASLMNG